MRNPPGSMIARILLIAVLTSLAFATALSLSAQSPSSPCADAPHRAFDFWVGDWTVTTKNGPKVGDSTIRRVLNDCVILESWTGTGGGTGQSFNNYDARRKNWKQFWVDAAGGRQEYEGVYQDGALRFSGITRVRKVSLPNNALPSSTSTLTTFASFRNSQPMAAKAGPSSTTFTTLVKNFSPHSTPGLTSPTPSAASRSN